MKSFILVIKFYCFSCTIATFGALTSQTLSAEKINYNAVFAYSAFGLLFGGSVPHYFYQLIGKLTENFGRFKNVGEFLLERALFAPVFCALSLYFLSIFEGKTHDQATQNLLKLYKSVLLTNWRYLSLPVFLNFNFVPPLLRVFVANIIGFFWIIYLADKRRRASIKKEKSK